MDSLDNLPEELIFKIICSVKYSTTMADSSRRLGVYDHLSGSKRDATKQLALCCLVCRRWYRISHKLLFEQVELDIMRNPEGLHRFSQSLERSNHLARLVRELTVLDEYGHLRNNDRNWLIDCLKLTTNLNKLWIRAFDERCLATNHVVRQICHLPNLKSLALIFRRHMRGFDPNLFLELPLSVEELHLSQVRDNLVALLPEICARLHAPQLIAATHQAEQPESCPGIEKQCTRVTGLRELKLHNPDYPAGLLPAISTSTPWLTSLALVARRYSHMTGINGPDLANFLNATPLLQHLFVSGLHPDSFAFWPHLTELRSLKVKIHEGHGGNLRDSANEDGFCQSMMGFISHCNRLRTLRLENRSDQEDLPQLIDGILKSTTKNGAISTLENLELYTRNPLPIDALEHLCQSAPPLQTLKFVLSHDHMDRAASALENLKGLLIVELVDRVTERVHTAGRKLGGDAIDVFALFERAKSAHNAIAGTKKNSLPTGSIIYVPLDPSEFYR